MSTPVSLEWRAEEEARVRALSNDQFIDEIILGGMNGCGDGPTMCYVCATREALILEMHRRMPA